MIADSMGAFLVVAMLAGVVCPSEQSLENLSESQQAAAVDGARHTTLGHLFDAIHPALAIDISAVLLILGAASVFWAEKLPQVLGEANRGPSMDCSHGGQMPPPAHRERYLEEFTAKLHELAQRSRRAEWGCALGLLASAWSLQCELRRAEDASGTRAVPVKTAGGVLSTAGLTAAITVAGWPAIIALSGLGAVAVLLVIWILGSTDRTDRLTQIVKSVQTRGHRETITPSAGKPLTTS